LGFTIGAGDVLGPRLTLGALGGDTPGCRGGPGEQLVGTGHLMVRAEAAVRLLTLTRADDPAKILSEYGLVIVDECHHVAAKTFAATIYRRSLSYGVAA
jgi:superfamily II DNA or RNA helicase